MFATHAFTRFTGIVATGLMLAFSSAAYAEEAATPEQSPRADLLDLLVDDHVLGNPDAAVKVIEYASLSCPHCMQYHLETYPKLKERYIDTGKIAFVYRHFPFNDPALRGAMLAECAGDEHFYKYINVLMKAQDKWAFSSDYVGSLRGLARIGGMSEEDFNACMDNKAIQDRIVAGMTWAAEELHINSTPTTFVNGEKLNGFQSIDDLARHIDPLLQESADSSAE